MSGSWSTGISKGHNKMSQSVNTGSPWTCRSLNLQRLDLCNWGKGDKFKLRTWIPPAPKWFIEYAKYVDVTDSTHADKTGFSVTFTKVLASEAEKKNHVLDEKDVVLGGSLDKCRQT